MERNYLMEVVCETTQSKDTQIRVTALQCLVKVMTLYYEFMDSYMGQALFPVSINCFNQFRVFPSFILIFVSLF